MRRLPTPLRLNCFIASLVVLSTCLQAAVIDAPNYRVFNILQTHSGNTYLEPRQDLLRVFKVLGYQHTLSVGRINDIAQATFLMQPPTARKKELWELKAKDLFKRKKLNLIEALRELDMIDEIGPRKKYYDAIAIHGTHRIVLANRILYTQYLWELGIRTPHIYFLTGKRDLDQETEIEIIRQQTTHNPRFESDLAMILWEQLITNQALKKIKITVVDAPKTLNKDLSLRRPNTWDTLLKWEKVTEISNIESCLFISNNPFIPYQHTTVESFFNQPHIKYNISIETVGSKAPLYSPLYKFHYYMDRLAKQIYTELQYFNK